jgi:hypothetical protein
MASSPNHTPKELANRLVDYADSIENPAAHEAEKDIRAAAAVLREVEDPMPAVPKLVAELTKIATSSSDLEARQTARALLGQPQS